MSGRCVMQSTWRVAPELAELPAHDLGDRAADARRRPRRRGATPSSSLRGARLFSASMMRDSSPPEAMRASGRGSSPGLVDRKNSTSSRPSGPIGAIALGELHAEARAVERQRLQLREERARQVARDAAALDGEPARPLDGGPARASRPPPRARRGRRRRPRRPPARRRPRRAGAISSSSVFAVLPREARDQREPLLDGLEPLRIGRQRAQVAAEARARLLQLGERPLEEPRASARCRGRTAPPP